eukprot:2634749-Pleurochrysis_carterae.AAC.1
MQLAEMSGHRGAKGFQQFSEQDRTSCLEHEVRCTCSPQSICLVRSSVSPNAHSPLSGRGAGLVRY